MNNTNKSTVIDEDGGIYILADRVPLFILSTAYDPEDDSNVAKEVVKIAVSLAESRGYSNSRKFLEFFKQRKQKKSRNEAIQLNEDIQEFVPYQEWLKILAYVSPNQKSFVMQA